MQPRTSTCDSSGSKTFRFEAWSSKWFERATGSSDRRLVWAFPRTDNTGSRRVAHDAGFRLVGEVGSEYPKGVPIRVNEWVDDILAEHP